MGSASSLAGQPPSWPRIILAPFQDRNRRKTFLCRGLTSLAQRFRDALFRGACPRQVRAVSAVDREQTWRHNCLPTARLQCLKIPPPVPREVCARCRACASELRDRLRYCLPSLRRSHALRAQLIEQAAFGIQPRDFVFVLIGQQLEIDLRYAARQLLRRRNAGALCARHLAEQCAVPCTIGGVLILA